MTNRRKRLVPSALSRIIRYWVKRSLKRFTGPVVYEARRIKKEFDEKAKAETTVIIYWCTLDRIVKVPNQQVILDQIDQVLKNNNLRSNLASITYTGVDTKKTLLNNPML